MASDTLCSKCGTLLFSVEYGGDIATRLTTGKGLQIILSKDDECVAQCHECGALTPAPAMRSVVKQLKRTTTPTS